MTDPGAAAASLPVVLTAALDANVLFPARLRDTLLDLAQAERYQPVWSAETLAELGRNLVARGGQPTEQVAALIAALRAEFPEATVGEADYLPLLARVTNQPRDRHVLAAAIAARASVIVTFNLRDFPADALGPWAITAQSPDEFLCDRFRAGSEVVAAAVMRQAARYRRPPMAVSELLDRLAGQVPAFVALVRAALVPPGA
jgi:predicted nucleic acid-binding protein